MSPFEVLGVGADASEIELKRAYARAIKRARPDENPQQFQELHEAYVSALDTLNWQRLTAQVSTDLQSVDGMEPELSPFDDAVDRTDLSTRAETPDPFEPQAFLDQLYALLDDPETDVDGWLRQQPALYSLSLKRAITPALVEELMQRPPLPPQTLQSLLAFFGIDILNREFDWLSDDLEELRERSAQVHEPWTSLKFQSANQPHVAENTFDWIWARILLWLLFLFMMFGRHWIQG